MITYLFNKIHVDNEEIKEISGTIEKYNKYFRDVSDSAIGKYSINNILETVEEALNYLEIYGPIIKEWIGSYLEKHRGELWLYYGISRGSYLTDYWKIKETDMSELSAWPFLFCRGDSKYNDFIVDLKGAQSEILRQRKRQNTSNPNYKPYHPDGCSSGCSCWMLDDMEQWYTEEREEMNASKNIFFNDKLQTNFYKEAIGELGGLKEQWENWVPFKSSGGPYKKLELIPGQTPIKIVLSWIKSDFHYSRILSMFSWSDSFKEIWENIDSVDDFIKCQRGKLKEILKVI